METAQQRIGLLITEARNRLRGRDLAMLLQDRPEHHAPAWHIHGILGHIFNVIVAAERLKEMTGVDVIDAATLHDIGKIYQFPAALKRFQAGQDGSTEYLGHEQLSASVAKRHGLGSMHRAVIDAHQHAYTQARPRTILKKLDCLTRENPIAVKCWLVLCAADAVGKGFTPNQIIQRPQIAQKFREVAETAQLSSNNKTLRICCEAVERWEPIPRENLPSFR